MLRSNPRCSLTLLELSNVLPDTSKAVSGVPESTCSHVGAFKRLCYCIYRIVLSWCSIDLCTGLRGTARAADETSAPLSW